MNDLIDEERRAEIETIRDVLVQFIAQAMERGVPQWDVASAMLGVAAKGLRLAVGPADAARHLRRMADQVEADRVEADRRPAGRH